MAYSAPRTWAAGERPTAAQFNQDIRDNVAFLANPPACRVFHSTTQSVTNNSTLDLSFDSERYDTDNMHSTSVNNNQININTAGLYLITATLEFVAATDYIANYIGIVLNNATFLAINSSGAHTDNSIGGLLSVTTVYKLAVSDFIEVRAYQENGAAAARNVQASAAYSPEFAATWIGLG